MPDDQQADLDFAFGMFDVQGGFAVSHQYDRSPAVIRPGDPIKLKAQTVHGYRSVTGYVIEGLGPYTPTEIRLQGDALAFKRVGNEWSAILLGSSDGTVQHYIIGAENQSGEVTWADGSHSLDTAKVFAHRVTSRRPPAWTEDAVMYQIFVDRFASADGPIDQPDDLMDWAGGDLNGITANLDWISDLGVTCVWITPVFRCGSSHGYDSIDYGSVDPRFGGDDALRRLVSEIHKRGMHLIMDIVPNHVSNNHEWFKAALAGGPERDWFSFDDAGNYEMFFTTESMPKLMLDHPQARQAMIDVAEQWITEFGIDGYRIDHALGPSESFFAALSTRINAVAPDAWLFGEVTTRPPFIPRYGGILDGVTDFTFAYGLREYMAGTISIDRFASLERASIAAIPAEDFSWVRFFDNHDMERGLARWEDDTETLARATEMLTSLPGVPTIFYGTEQALTNDLRESQGGMEVGRVAMTFDRDHPMYGITRAAISQRRDAAASQADPVWWTTEDSSWSWGSVDDG